MWWPQGAVAKSQFASPGFTTPNAYIVSRHSSSTTSLGQKTLPVKQSKRFECTGCFELYGKRGDECYNCIFKQNYSYKLRFQEHELGSVSFELSNCGSLSHLGLGQLGLEVFDNCICSVTSLLQEGELRYELLLVGLLGLGEGARRRAGLYLCQHISLEKLYRIRCD